MTDARTPDAGPAPPPFDLGAVPGDPPALSRASRLLWCAALLEQLDRREFHIGVEHYLRVERLLDRIGPEVPLAELARRICPIVATSRDQQAAFHKAFGEYLDRAGLSWALDRDSVDLAPVAAPDPWRARVARLAHRYGAAVARSSAVVALLAMIVVTTRQPPQRAGLGGPAPTDSDRASIAPPDTSLPFDTRAGTDSVRDAELLVRQYPIVEPGPWYEEHATLLRRSGMALPLLVVACLEWLRWRRARAVVQREQRADPPFAWTPDAPPATTGPWTVDELRLTSRAVRRRQRTNVLQFSPERSVGATVANLGRPTLVYTNTTRPPDYLVLVERVSAHDHQACLFDALADRLHDEGAEVTRYYFGRDPRYCFVPGSDAPVRLAELHRLHPEFRLVVFGAGAGFLDPMTGSPEPWTELFDAWEDRALLTPTAPVDWSGREARLARGFLVLPATLRGLQAAADHFEASTRPNLRSWRERSDAPSAPDEAFATAASLRAYMGNDAAFRWLCACAVYPELHWSLSLDLASLPSLTGRVLTEESILRLVRLPWFRTGSMPDALRRDLLEALARLDEGTGRDTELEARTRLVTVLEDTKVEPDSVAARDHDRELLLNRLYIHRDDRPKVAALMKELLELSPPRGLARDVVVMRLLSRLKPPRLALVLPERFRERLSRSRVPWFGVTRAASFVVAAAVSLAAWAWGPREQPLLFGSMELAPRALAMSPGTKVRLSATGELVAGLPVRPSPQWGHTGSAGGVVVEPHAILNVSGTTLHSRAVVAARDTGWATVWSSIGRQRVESVVRVQPSMPGVSGFLAWIAPTRLVAVGVPMRIPLTFSDVAIIDEAPSLSDEASERLRGPGPGWVSCDPARASIDSVGVIVARRPGWFFVAHANDYTQELVPVYAAARPLSTDERELVDPVFLYPTMVGATDEAAFARSAAGTAMARKVAALARMPRTQRPRMHMTTYDRSGGRVVKLVRVSTAIDQLSDVVRMDSIVEDSSLASIRDCQGSAALSLIGLELIRLDFDAAGDTTTKPAPVPIFAVDSLNLRVGDTARVAYTIASDVEIPARRFTIAPATVASVSSDGVVRARAAGRATLTLSTGTGNSSISVIVRADDLAPSYIGELLGPNHVTLVVRLTLQPAGGDAYRGSLESLLAATSEEDALDDIGYELDTTMLAGRYDRSSRALLARPADDALGSQLRLQFAAGEATFRGAVPGLVPPDTFTLSGRAGTADPRAQLRTACARFRATPVPALGMVVGARMKLVATGAAPRYVSWGSITPRITAQADGTIDATAPGVGLVVAACGTRRDTLRIVVRDTVARSESPVQSTPDKTAEPDLDAFALRLHREASPRTSPKDPVVMQLVRELHDTESRLDVVRKWYDSYGAKLEGAALIRSVYRVLTCQASLPSGAGIAADSATANGSRDAIIGMIARRPDVLARWSSCIGGRPPVPAAASAP